MVRAALIVVLLLPTLLPAQVRRTAHGDTTFVVTKGVGVWGAAHPAVEVARIGGGSSKETMLSRPTTLTALPDGGVIFFDDKALDGPVIRWFDAQGKFIRNLGRYGSGPGEFHNSLDIKIAPDGRVWVADVGNARVSIFSRDGKFVSQLPIPGNSWSLDMLRPAKGGGLFLMEPTFVRNEGGFPGTAFAILRMDRTGRILDTLKAPRTVGAAATAGAERPMILPDGRLVQPARDRMGFVLQAAGPAKHPVLVASLDISRVRYTDQERHVHDSLQKVVQRGGTAGDRQVAPSSSALPEFRGDVSNVKVDTDGRTWVQRAAPAGAPQIDEKSGRPYFVPPVIYDAFGLDGTFLGEVSFPKVKYGYTASFAGDLVWIVQEGEDGEVYLVKYRVH